MIVPTKYYTVPTDQFRDWGISMVIWANHNMRASISAMQDVTQQIYKDQSLVNVEKKVRMKLLAYLTFEIKVFHILFLVWY